MNKRTYYIIITIAFAVISIPTVVNIILQEQFLPYLIDRALIKIFLILFICFMEVSYCSGKVYRILGWISTVVLFIGIDFRILHWAFGAEIIIVAGTAVLAVLITSAMKEKNKNLLHYLLIAFVPIRLAIILSSPNNLLWWADMIICFAIMLAGIKELRFENKRRNINNHSTKELE